MRIALCANTSWYLYNYRRNLINALRQRGHAVSAIAPPDDYSDRLRALGVAWHPLAMRQNGTNPFEEAATLRDLSRRLRQIRPDALLTFTVKCNLYAGLLNRRRFRHLANVSGLGELFDRQTLLTRLARRLYKIAFARAHAVFFQNREDLATFLNHGLILPERAERLPGSGVDVSAFMPDPDYQPGTPRAFLMFGRLLPKKGYDLFLQAAERLPDARCWILGIPDPRRADSRALFERIQARHARRVLIYFPATDNVLPLLRQADVVALPSSYHEGVPRCLLEALACGKPLITTDWKGCRDAVEHGQNGLLIPPNDVDALTQAMTFFCRADAGTLLKMGEFSRRKAEREFDEQQIIMRYLNALDGDF